MQRQSLVKAFTYAFSGIWTNVKSERNVKIDLVFGALAIIAAAILQLNVMEWAIILILIGCVLAAELFNTSLETLVDLACPKIDPLAKKAKDTAAGAVLVLTIVAVVAGLVIYINAALRLWG
jgi:diacylglycerol kinase (ATP)